MNEIICPKNLNQFLLREPLFENAFTEDECEKRKFYGDCFHCFATAIAKRDNQIKSVEGLITQIEKLRKTEAVGSIEHLTAIAFNSAIGQVVKIIKEYYEVIE